MVRPPAGGVSLAVVTSLPQRCTTLRCLTRLPALPTLIYRCADPRIGTRADSRMRALDPAIAVLKDPPVQDDEIRLGMSTPWSRRSAFSGGCITHWWGQFCGNGKLLF